ncbi:MAG TPA: GGDEF domain-containing protein [Symbiobacteriaceae bacterium]|jgi:diguanylate cyclase (GGDEF)-like protein
MYWWTIASLGLLTVGLLSYILILRRRCTNLTAELQQQASHANDLSSVNRIVHQLTEVDWQRYPAVLVQEIVTQGYATRAALLAVGEQGQLEIRATTSTDGAIWDPRAQPAVQTAMRNKQRVHLSDEHEIYLPILEKTEPIGLLAITCAASDSAQNDQSPFLDASAALVHLAMINQRTLTRQLSLSTTDGLTGLMNHRHFQQVLSVILAQSYLEHTHLALVMLDIDHFKKLNDTYGHLFGDLVLREVASVVRHAVPTDALAARYGGEEFAVVLPSYSVPQAAEVAEKLRLAIETHRIPDPTTGHPVGVTISGGISAYVLGMGKSRLIARADEALYMSKQTGRNRISILAPERGDEVAAARA